MGATPYIWTPPRLSPCTPNMARSTATRSMPTSSRGRLPSSLQNTDDFLVIGKTSFPRQDATHRCCLIMSFIPQFISYVAALRFRYMLVITIVKQSFQIHVCFRISSHDLFLDSSSFGYMPLVEGLMHAYSFFLCMDHSL